MSRADLERIRKLEVALRALLKALDAYKQDVTYETNWQLMASHIDAKRVLDGKDEANDK